MEPEDVELTDSEINRIVLLAFIGAAILTILIVTLPFLIIFN